MKNFIYRILICFFLLPEASAGEWNIYLDGNDVVELAQDGDYLWFACYTCLVRYNRIDGTHRFYTLRDYGDGFGFNVAGVAPDGAKWFGASNGKLLRHDGFEWSVYDHAAKLTSQSGSKITSIVFDRDGSAWFGTKNGVVRFDGLSWKRFGASEGFTNGEILAAVIDCTGNLWFGSSEGLFRFNGAEWTRYDVSADGVRKDKVTALACESDGTLWIGTERGLATFDGTTWKYTASLGEKPNERRVTTLAIGKDGAVWAGTLDGIAVIREGGEAVRRIDKTYLTHDWIMKTLVDSDGVLWVAAGASRGPYSTRLGVLRYDGSCWSKVVTLPEITNNAVRYIATDSENRKWFPAGAEVKLGAFDGSSWRNYTPEDGPVFSNGIAVDSEGQRWVAVGGDGSWREWKDWPALALPDSLAGVVPQAGAYDHDGVLWAVLRNELYSSDGQSWTCWTDILQSQGLVGAHIYRIVVDHANNRWFDASPSGLFRYDGKNWRRFTMEDGLAGTNINCMVVDHENVLWLGTGLLGNQPGVSSFDGKVWKIHRNDMFMNATGIAVDDNNVKWIAAFDSMDIFAYDDSTWKRYSPPWTSLFNQLGGYWCIGIDHDGTKWIGAQYMGIVSFRESDGGTVTGVKSEQEQPRACVLHSAHPNPFNPSTILSFTLGKPDHVTLDVFSVTGQKVATLVDSRLSAGMHQYAFDGSRLSSGLYFYRLRTSQGVEHGKCMLIK